MGREVSGRHRTGCCATLAAAVSYFVMGVADADYLTGNKLFEECQQNSNLFLSGACLGYIAGVVDALHTSSEFWCSKWEQGQAETAGGRRRSHYLHDHPEKRRVASI